MLDKKMFFLVILFSCILLNAQPNPPQDELKSKSEFRMHERLNLNDAQKEEIWKIREEMQEKVIDFEYSIKKAELELKKMIKDEDFENAKKIFNKISDLEKQIKELRFNEKLKIFNLLDKNQREIFKKFILKRDNRRPPLNKDRK